MQFRVLSHRQEDDVVGENQDEGDAGNESDMDLDLLAESESDSEASNHSNQVNILSAYKKMTDGFLRFL